jgi:hypothetical protein
MQLHSNNISMHLTIRANIKCEYWLIWKENLEESGSDDVSQWYWVQYFVLEMKYN